MPILTVFEHVLEHLRTKILSGELKSGDKIVIEEVASNISVSVTPVREALKCLAKEGLVKWMPRKGWEISVLSKEEVLQIFDIQEMSERHVLNRLVKDNYEFDFEKLNEINQNIAQLINQERWQDIAEENSFFHLSLYEGYPNDLLLDYMTELWNRAGLYRQSMYRNGAFNKHAVEEHMKLLSALKNRDLEFLNVAIDEHWSSGRRFMRDL